jgi:hypothetical protein
MRRALILLPLLLGGCSCQRDAEQDRQPAPPGAETPADAPIDVSANAVESITTVAPPALSAVAPDAASEPITVRNYIYALMSPDRGAADAFWAGGRTSARPDDTVLRSMPALRSLRVDTESPIARDTAEPSRLREVPVRIRAVTADTTLYYHGWYRLQPRPDGSGWEIQSASLQPTLD